MKAAIFDMDGTILDSMGMWADTFPIFMEKLGLVPDEKFLHETSSLGLHGTARAMVERYNLSLTPEQLEQEWEKCIGENYLTLVKPKPFVVEYIMQLKAQGIPVAVATLTEHRIADPALAYHGLDVLFDEILTCEDVGGVTKDRPDLFLKAAELLGATASESVVFEDSYYAMVPAREAGFQVIAIHEPYATNSEEIREVAHRYIHSWEELLIQQETVHA